MLKFKIPRPSINMDVIRPGIIALKLLKIEFQI